MKSIMKSIMKSSLSSLMSTFLIVAVLCLSASQVSAQRRSKDSRKDTPAAGAIAKDGNTPAKDGQLTKRKGPESLEKFIKKDARVMNGLTTVYNQDDKWYISISDSIIGRDLELVSRISKSAEGGRKGSEGYAGDILSHEMVRFSKGPGNKIFLHHVMLEERAAKSPICTLLMPR